MKDERASGDAQAGGAPLTRTNRHGRVYYLHEGTTKTGKPRYFAARNIRTGVLTAMPAGYEFAESINGVVSVRRVDPSRPKLPPDNLELVRRELARWERLRGYEVEERRGAIVIHEPVGGVPDKALAKLADLFASTPARLRMDLGPRLGKTQLDPVMRFVSSAADADLEAGEYAVERMTYRGDGGWRHLDTGALDDLVDEYVHLIGTDEPFELL